MNPPPQAGPATTAGGRPRYLLVALVVALVFGAGCWTEGFARLQFYRGARDGGTALNAEIRDEVERTRAEELYKRFVDVANDARDRAIPMAAAQFVLGAALLAMAARGLAGRSNARAALMQVVTVQAVVVAAGWFVTRDVTEAEMDWHLARTLAHEREELKPQELAQLVPVLEGARRYGGPTWLVIRTLASALIVVALTRQRSRDFFEAAAGAAPER